MAPHATERARAELKAFNQDYELLTELNHHFRYYTDASARD